MEKDMLSIISNRKTKSLVEKTAAIIFRGCAIVSIIAVVSITGYMIISGTPAIFKEGLLEILFGTVWAPTAADPPQPVRPKHNTNVNKTPNTFFIFLIPFLFIKLKTRI